MKRKNTKYARTAAPDSYSDMWSVFSSRRAPLTRWLPVGVVVGGLLALPVISSAATPPAPKPPLAYTGYVPEVTETTATLRGGLIPRGTETGYYFQYGPSPAYGSQTQSLQAGSGTQEVKVSQAITGLIANTTYHYRLVAVSLGGPAVGQDRTFSTKKTPLKIAILATHNPQLFGNGLTVSGTVSGSDAANQSIVLQANPFPYVAGFSTVGGPETTDAAGNFFFPLAGLPQSTQLRVTTVSSPKVLSPVVTELVAVRVSLHARPTARHGFVRLYGWVTPAGVGTLVGFQWIRRGHRPLTVSATTIHKANSSVSRFSRVVRIRHRGLYRAYVHVTTGKLISHYSRTVAIR